MTACDDDCVELFNTYEARNLKSVSSRKYGCRCVTYTHSPNCVLVASAKGNSHAIRYLSLHDNRSGSLQDMHDILCDQMAALFRRAFTECDVHFNVGRERSVSLSRRRSRGRRRCPSDVALRGC